MTDKNTTGKAGSASAPAPNPAPSPAPAQPSAAAKSGKDAKRLYDVVTMPVRHGNKKQVRVYPVGAQIELTADEAARLSGIVRPSAKKE